MARISKCSICKKETIKTYIRENRLVCPFCNNIDAIKNTKIIINKKYKFTGKEKKGKGGVILKEIISTKNFGKITEDIKGGWIEGEHNLSHEGNSWVHQRAAVYGNARVYDDAQVMQNVLIYGNAQIFENAYVYHGCWIRDDVKIYGNSSICGKCDITDKVEVFDNARVGGHALIKDLAVICEDAQVFGLVTIQGASIIKGECEISKEIIINNKTIAGTTKLEMIPSKRK